MKPSKNSPGLVRLAKSLGVRWGVPSFDVAPVKKAGIQSQI
jgi:hypothetical protein